MKKEFLFFLFTIALFGCNQQSNDQLKKNNLVSLNNSKVLVTDGIIKSKKSNPVTIIKTLNPKLVSAGKSKITILENSISFDFYNSKGFIPGSCTSILQDKDGFYWFGTLNGICKVKDTLISWITEKEGLPSNSVNSILEDRRGGLWIGMSGGGLSYFDGKTFTNYTKEDGLPSSTIYRIFQDKKDNIWLGTSKGASSFNGKFFTNYSENEGFSNLEVRCIIQDKNGDYWLGTFGEGVFKFNGENFTNFTTSEGLAGNAINCLYEDKFGNILIGCLRSGLSAYDGHSMVTIPVSKEVSGRTSNTYDRLKIMPSDPNEICSDIRSIIQDKYGIVWLGLSHGIGQLVSVDSSHFKSKISLYLDLSIAKKYLNYDYESCNINCVYLTKKGDILWGIEDKIREIIPTGTIKSNLNSKGPTVFIKNIKLFNENIEWNNYKTEKESRLKNGVVLHNLKFESINPFYYFPEKLTLSYDNNNISFGFNAVNENSEKVAEFKYKLEGIEDNWTSLETNSEVPFNSLPHGEYSFLLKAMSKNGIWSSPISYTFTIRPPWWHTWWFRTISLGFILGFSYGFYRWRISSLKKRQGELEKTVLERTNELVEEKKVVEEQKQIVEHKQKEILDSIYYAQRIQRALMPSEKYIAKKLKDFQK